MDGHIRGRKFTEKKKKKKRKKKVEEIQLDNLANLGSPSSKNEQAFSPIGLLLQVLCLYSNPNSIKNIAY